MEIPHAGARAVLATGATLLLLTGCTTAEEPASGRPGDAPAASTGPTPGGTASGEQVGRPDEVPAPPQRTRWAGVGELVVAVPAGWATATGYCDAAPPRTVLVRTLLPPAARCARPGRGGSPSLTISAPGTLGWSPDRGVGCRAGSSGPCHTLVSGGGSRFVVTYHGPGAGREVLALANSATVLPEGFTTVPAIDLGRGTGGARRLLARAGLVGVAPDVEFPHYVVSTRPRAGSPVAEGSRVALRVGDG